jgi:anti-sigma regulatory factor (Ser/Thr protein kinase)
MQLEFDARIENIGLLTGVVEELLEPLEAPMKACMQINVAIDELLSNICYYAYGDGVGKAYVTVETMPDKRGISITLEDEGEPFNPLSHEDPDVTLGLDERGIGGLGIMLVKRTMDDVRYEYKNGRNRLTFVKTF